MLVEIAFLTPSKSAVASLDKYNLVPGRFSKICVTPVARVNTPTEELIRMCPMHEADFFGVYGVDDTNCHEWLEDFPTVEEAQDFARAVGEKLDNKCYFALIAV